MVGTWESAWLKGRRWGLGKAGASSVMVQVQDIQPAYPRIWKVTVQWSFPPGMLYLWILDM